MTRTSNEATFITILILFTINLSNELDRAKNFDHMEQNNNNTPGTSIHHAKIFRKIMISNVLYLSQA